MDVSRAERKAARELDNTSKTIDGGGKPRRGWHLFGPTCPKCGKQTVHRKRKSDGEPFFGCRAYPICKGIATVQALPPKVIAT